LRDGALVGRGADVGDDGRCDGVRRREDTAVLGCPPLATKLLGDRIESRPRAGGDRSVKGAGQLSGAPKGLASGMLRRVQLGIPACARFTAPGAPPVSAPEERSDLVERRVADLLHGHARTVSWLMGATHGASDACREFGFDAGRGETGPQARRRSAGLALFSDADAATVSPAPARCCEGRGEPVQLPRLTAV
jgi:hypothetical protein